MQIEKLNELEAEIVTQVPASEKREKVNLDEINNLIDAKTREIESYQEQAKSILAGVENLKLEKAELVAKKKALKDAGLKTNAEKLEADLKLQEALPPVQEII